MEEGPDSLILRYLRRLDGGQDAIRAELADIKGRLQALELGVADLRRDNANMHTDLVRIDHRFDAVDARLSRIERRLELREAADV